MEGYHELYNLARKLGQENLRLRKELEEARQTLEEVCIGQKLECPTCGKFKPCCCDKS